MKKITTLTLTTLLLAPLAALHPGGAPWKKPNPPQRVNIVLIFADDWGLGRFVVPRGGLGEAFLSNHELAWDRIPNRWEVVITINSAEES